MGSDLAERVKRLIREKGQKRASEILKASRGALLRVAAGLDGNQNISRCVERELDAFEAAQPVEVSDAG